MEQYCLDCQNRDWDSRKILLKCYVWRLPVILQWVKNNYMERKWHMSDTELLDYNIRGIIPAPNETEDDLKRRAIFCFNLPQELSTRIDPQIPFTTNEIGSPAVLNESFSRARHVYDIAPDWIPLFFSNYELPLWLGGCAWIFQLDENTPATAILQLRRAFSKGKRYLGIYRRDEVVTHEFSHIGRMTFEEPRYEELIAYKSSTHPLRRWLGPLAESPTESGLFVMTLILLFLLDIFFLSFGYLNAFFHAMWFKLFPLALIFLALFRLWRKHRTFSACLKNLDIALGDERLANAVVYRLTDEEIDSFATKTPEEIIAFAAQNKEDSLRWRLISIAYFGKGLL